jgi:hypothetical protein
MLVYSTPSLPVHFVASYQWSDIMHYIFANQFRAPLLESKVNSRVFFLPKYLDYIK